MNGRGHALAHYLDSLSPAEVRQLAGARDRLAILAESDLGPWITIRPGVPVLDLADVIATGSVAYFAPGLGPPPPLSTDARRGL